MKKFTCFVSVFLFAGMTCLIGQDIPEKKSTGFKCDPAIENIKLARQAMVYGYEHNDPVSLLMAARLYSEWTPEPLAPESATTKSGEEPQKVAEPFNVVKMLNDAVIFSGNDPGVQKLADEIAAGSSKGSKKGPMYGEYVLNGQEYVKLELKFKGGEIAIVGAAGDGNADIDLYIYDKDKNLVVADESEDYECAVMWLPEKTALYYIIVLNQGTNSTRCAVLTN